MDDLIHVSDTFGSSVSSSLGIISVLCTATNNLAASSGIRTVGLTGPAGLPSEMALSLQSSIIKFGAGSVCTQNSDGTDIVFTVCGGYMRCVQSKTEL